MGKHAGNVDDVLVVMMMWRFANCVEGLKIQERVRSFAPFANH